MKFTDVLVNILKANGVSHVFGLQGGAVVHIFDSFEKSGVGVTYTNHEVSAALAAAAHAKVTGEIGCVAITTGPGCTNAITGLLGAWQDSIPCIFLSGQVRSNHTSYGRKVRQVGTQEVNICDVVEPLTKYTKFISNKDDLIPELYKAIEIAHDGRPGPVWIDLPVDFHWSDIPFDKNNILEFKGTNNASLLLNHDDALKSLELLNDSQKPLFVFGYGLRLSGHLSHLNKLIEHNNIPFVTTWTASDLFPTEHPLNLGIIGMSGQRGANRAVFNSDLLICLGTHLSISQTTTLFDSYAPDAKKIIVNIDIDQLDNLNVKFDLKIHSDLAKYVEWLTKQSIASFFWKDIDFFKSQNWYYPETNELPNSNVFVRELTKLSNEKQCLIVDGGGTALYSGFQSSVLKSGDRIICSSAMSSMGTGLAETIGVSKSNVFSKYICIIGDGSILMNIQDLQTIKQDNINVIICIINNNGYLAIRNTQNEFLEGRLYGTHPDWNLTMPSFEKIAYGFDISYVSLNKAHNVNQVVKDLLSSTGPVICEVFVDENQEVLFRQGYAHNKDGTFSPQSLYEMAPFMKLN